MAQTQPQPQPQPQEKTPNVEQKDFYGYLFDEHKSPTPVLNALLRGIANYIVRMFVHFRNLHLRFYAYNYRR